MRKITDAGTYSMQGQNVPIAFRGRSDRHNAHRRANTTRYSDLSQGTGMEDLYAIMNKYRIKGFEFGNWVTQEERAEYVAALNTTLEELYSIIGSRNLGIDRNVGIAFGARGSRGAIAHYEPVCNMINLTREHGAGSLAHEYGHAIDYNFGGFVDQHKTYTALSGNRSTAATLPDNVGGILRHYVNQIVDSIRNGKNFAKMEEINKAQRAIDGNIVYGEYYFRRTEIFARFFEQYVSYCLYERGISNRLLAKSWATYMSNVVYVQKDDFLKIKPVADKLMKELVVFMNSTRSIRARAAAYPKPVIVKPKKEEKPKPEPKKIVAPKKPKTTTGKAATTSKKKDTKDLKPAEMKLTPRHFWTVWFDGDTVRLSKTIFSDHYHIAGHSKGASFDKVQCFFHTVSGKNYPNAGSDHWLKTWVKKDKECYKAAVKRGEYSTHGDVIKKVEGRDWYFRDIDDAERFAKKHLPEGGKYLEYDVSEENWRHMLDIISGRIKIK